MTLSKILSYLKFYWENNKREINQYYTLLPRVNTAIFSSSNSTGFLEINFVKNSLELWRDGLQRSQEDSPFHITRLQGGVKWACFPNFKKFIETLWLQVCGFDIYPQFVPTHPKQSKQKENFRFGRTPSPMFNVFDTNAIFLKEAFNACRFVVLTLSPICPCQPEANQSKRKP